VASITVSGMIVATVLGVVQRLLHSPMVRVRQLASTAGGDQYAAVLRELFDLSVPPADADVSRAVAVQPEDDASPTWAEPDGMSGRGGEQS